MTAIATPPDTVVQQDRARVEAADKSSAHPCFLVLSAHDYRTPRRASIHFIAEELATRGPTRFFSLRYSRLSKWKRDARVVLDGKANHVELHDGVECLLWKTAIHPFNTHRAWLRPLESMLFRLYARQAPAILKRWIREADAIVFESGTAIVFVALARRLNPRARLIYRASDGLDAINVAPFVKRELTDVVPTLDVVALVSPGMLDDVGRKPNVFHVGHGLDPALAALGDPSPYGPGLHAVSVGSMLFDPHCIAIASQAFPDVTFHVIGSGRDAMPDYGPNVRVHGEMKHAQTIPYIKHATFGLAPYASQDVPAYLADSSMKLLQYDFFGLPAVCPFAVVGDYGSRFGYTPGDADSIVAAIERALVAPRVSHRTHLGWPATVDRLLQPEAYPDVHL